MSWFEHAAAFVIILGYTSFVYSMGWLLARITYREDCERLRDELSYFQNRMPTRRLVAGALARKYQEN